QLLRPANGFRVDFLAVGIFGLQMEETGVRIPGIPAAQRTLAGEIPGVPLLEALQECLRDQAPDGMPQRFLSVLRPAPEGCFFSFPAGKEIQDRGSLYRSLNFSARQKIFNAELLALPVGNERQRAAQQPYTQAASAARSLFRALHPGAPATPVLAAP